jgi:hypothetical protein
VVTGVGKEGMSFLRGILGKGILVISGQSRMMYQDLVPKPEGAIFTKRSKPQGGLQLSSRHHRQFGRMSGGDANRELA